MYKCYDSCETEDMNSPAVAPESYPPLCSTQPDNEPVICRIFIKAVPEHFLNITEAALVFSGTVMIKCHLDSPILNKYF